ncbi:hypothetical protein N7490_004465 [Penicillium lividum]|nr:hypothetical protein N7490_004465 [Penicillium lividum]
MFEPVLETIYEEVFNMDDLRPAMWGSVAAPVSHSKARLNEPYRSSPSIPELLNRPVVRVAVATNLPAQDIDDWQTTRHFHIWWRTLSQVIGYELESALGLTTSMGLAFSQFQKLMGWVVKRCASKRQAEDTIRWTRETQNSPSQTSHFRQTLAHFRCSSPLQIREPRVVRCRLQPERSIISRPIWEEAESQGELIEISSWEYSDALPYSSLNRTAHQTNTARFSIEQMVLASQSS